MSVTRITMVYPSHFDDSFRKKDPRFVTYHHLQPTYDESGYVKTFGRFLKVVHRDMETNKIIAIMPF